MATTPRFLLTTARQVVRPRAGGAVCQFTVSTRRGNATAVDPLKPKPWTRQEVQEVYDTPLFELIFRSVSLSLLIEPHIHLETFSRFPNPNLTLSLGCTGFSTPIEPPS
jgi:biotin synthase